MPRENLTKMLRESGMAPDAAKTEARKLRISSKETFVRFSYWPDPTETEPGEFGLGFSVAHQYFELDYKAEDAESAVRHLGMLRYALEKAGAQCNPDNELLKSRWGFGGD